VGKASPQIKRQILERYLKSLKQAESRPPEVKKGLSGVLERFGLRMG
jgi:hypothetical protein